MSVRDIHNLAMESMILASRHSDPCNPNAVLTYYEKAFELENQAATESLANENATALTWSVLCRSAAWIAIKAQKFDEAERIALTALARGAHPEEKEKLREVLFCAMKKLGVHDPTEDDTAVEEAVDEKELAAV